MIPRNLIFAIQCKIDQEFGAQVSHDYFEARSNLSYAVTSAGVGCPSIYFYCNYVIYSTERDNCGVKAPGSYMYNTHRIEYSNPELTNILIDSIRKNSLHSAAWHCDD